MVKRFSTVEIRVTQEDRVSQVNNGWYWVDTVLKYRLPALFVVLVSAIFNHVQAEKGLLYDCSFNVDLF